MTHIELTPVSEITETESDCCPLGCEPGCTCGRCPCCE